MYSHHYEVSDREYWRVSKRYFAELNGEDPCPREWMKHIVEHMGLVFVINTDRTCWWVRYRGIPEAKIPRGDTSHRTNSLKTRLETYLDELITLHSVQAATAESFFLGVAVNNQQTVSSGKRNLGIDHPVRKKVTYLAASDQQLYDANLGTSSAMHYESEIESEPELPDKLGYEDLDSPIENVAIRLNEVDKEKMEELFLTIPDKRIIIGIDEESKLDLTTEFFTMVRHSIRSYKSLSFYMPYTVW
ncbi:hypothetical protein HK096_007034 [Nowakowskiella sp. JEL0078]|nr:hypothetical protein HK096_007034 [Nowakowskiella sp. JEL0078]